MTPLSAVKGLVYEAGVGVFQVRRDEARVGSAVVHLYLHDHPLEICPTAGQPVNKAQAVVKLNQAATIPPG